MEKCLITKLNVTINNENCPKIGEIVSFIDTNKFGDAGFCKVKVSGSEYPSIRTTGTLYIYKEDKSGFYGDIENCQSVSGYTPAIQCNFKGKGNLYIYDGYKCTELWANNNMIVDLAQIALRSNMLLLMLTTATVIGTVSKENIGKLTSLTLLRLNNLTLNPYSIMDLSGLTSLTELLTGPGYGTVEQFVSKQFETRRSGLLQMSDYGSQVTLNGIKNSTVNIRLFIEFSANSVTVSRNSNLLATYNGSTWTYNS